MTGLSIKTLAYALFEEAALMGHTSEAGENGSPIAWEDYVRARDRAFRLRAALATKSERMEAMERQAALDETATKIGRFSIEKARLSRLLSAAEEKLHAAGDSGEAAEVISRLERKSSSFRVQLMAVRAEHSRLVLAALAARDAVQEGAPCPT